MVVSALTRVQQTTAGAFDRVRRARNQDRYTARPVGVAVSVKAEQVAREFFDGDVARGIIP